MGGDQLIINGWSGGPAIIGEINLEAARYTPIVIEFMREVEMPALLEWRNDLNAEFQEIELRYLRAPEASSGLPKVGIAVRDGRALEGYDPASYTVYRMGSLDNELEIQLTYSGEAEEGLDYVNPTRTLTIPAGQHARDFNISRSNDELYRGNKELIVSVADTKTTHYYLIVAFLCR